MATIIEITNWFGKRNNRLFIGSNVNNSLVVNAPRNITEAEQNHISFIGKKLGATFTHLVESTRCKIILIEEIFLPELEKIKLPQDAVFIISKNPKTDIVEYCKEFLNFGKSPSISAIDSKASISSSARIGKNLIIGAFTVIGDNVTIGENCIIGSNTIIHDNTVIGNNVDIGSCTVIGEVGYGYTRNSPLEEYELFPHYGSVIIRDNVHIGSCTNIARGSLSDTVIGEGTKIDSQVHIAHNVKIGKNTLIIGKVEIAGSVVIGENCWISPFSCIRNGITIGNNVTISLNSTVTRNVSDNEVLIGNPAIPINDFTILYLQNLRMIKESKKGK